MEIHTLQNQKGNTYYLFELKDLQLFLFGEDLFWKENITDVVKGNVTTKHWNSERFCQVGNWKKTGEIIEFNVSGLGEFTAVPMPKHPGKFTVKEDPVPTGLLQRKVYDAKLKAHIPDDTELSLYILNSLWE